jgi:hypothetical protein
LHVTRPQTVTSIFVLMLDYRLEVVLDVTKAVTGIFLILLRSVEKNQKNSLRLVYHDSCVTYSMQIGIV